MTLKDVRLSKNLTQAQVAELLGISLRSYKSYENEEEKKGTLKYKYFMNELAEVNRVDEEHGILTLDEIKKKCVPILEKYKVSFCYLFGSYAKNKANATSDVDLLVSTDISGLKYYGLVEEIRTTLQKRVDVLNLDQLKDNIELTAEILKDGIKIYG